MDLPRICYGPNRCQRCHGHRQFPAEYGQPVGYQFSWGQIIELRTAAPERYEGSSGRGHHE